MERLSVFEELAIVRQAKEGNFLDHGSSRAVFSISDTHVVKVAMDRQGQYQNMREIQAYRNMGEPQGPLAEITGYGKYCVVMEKVVPLDYDLVRDIVQYDDDDDYDSYSECSDCSDCSNYSEPVASNAGQKLLNYIIADYGIGNAETLNHVRDVFGFTQYNIGHTSDHYQIGLRADGTATCYDYGFEPGNYDTCVSNSLYGTIISLGEYGLLDMIEKRLLRKSF